MIEVLMAQDHFLDLACIVTTLPESLDRARAGAGFEQLCQHDIANATVGGQAENIFPWARHERDHYLRGGLFQILHQTKVP